MTNRVRVFTQSNTMIALGVAFFWWLVIATFSLWYGIAAQLALPFIGPMDKLQTIVRLYLEPGVYMSTQHLIITIILSLLVGINAALIWHIYSYRRDILSFESKTAGIFSMILMFLGTGCAACGSLVLVSIATMLGVGVSASMLPAIGQLVMIAAIALLLHANYRLYRQASNPLVCTLL